MPIYVKRPETFEYDVMTLASSTTTSDIVTWVESMRNVECQVWESPDHFLVITSKSDNLISQVEFPKGDGVTVAVDGNGHVSEGIPSNLVPYEDVYVSPPVL